MVPVVSSTNPNTQVVPESASEADPFAGMPFGDMLGASTATVGGGSGDIESLASDLIMQLVALTPETEATAAAMFSELISLIADQLNSVDLTSPEASAGLQEAFSGIMALTLAQPVSTEMHVLSGIVDTASAALSLAVNDPLVGGEAIDMVSALFATMSANFASVAAGTSDFTTTAEAALEELYAAYMSVYEMAATSGIEITSLAVGQLPSQDVSEADPLTESLTTDVEADPLTGSLTTDVEADPLTGSLTTDVEVDTLPDEGSTEVDDILGDYSLDPTEPTDDPIMGEEGFDVNELLEDFSLDQEEPTDTTTTPIASEETTEMDDILEEFSLDPEDTGTTDPTIAPVTGEPEVSAEDAAAGLSSESSTDGDPSAENQAALEGRYISLYESLMEKQIAFKEAIEPYKTDNQNAGKG